jgi:hypothetical protein
MRLDRKSPLLKLIPSVKLKGLVPCGCKERPANCFRKLNINYGKLAYEHHYGKLAYEHNHLTVTMDIII